MSDGTLQTLDVTMLDDVNNASGLIQLDSNAKIPACSGAAITNLPGVTKNASDPATDTNPSGGVGTVWQNTTSGEMYICTDATTGQNTWKNIGAGSGNIVPFVFGGESYGFASGNHDNAGGNDTNRFSFASGSQNGEHWGTLVGSVRYVKSGHSDKANGYAFNCGGYGTPTNEIIRFSMISSSTSNDAGDLTQLSDGQASMGTATHGYIAGNGAYPYNDQARVEKFAFAASTSSTDFSDLMQSVAGAAGTTNGTGTYGYAMGGYSGGYTNVIQKINLTTAATATDVANLSQGRNAAGGTSSTTHGYVAGGYSGATSNVIDKMAFATDADSTDVGDNTVSIHSRGGSSSTTYGYSLGGTGHLDVIERHSFSSDGNATDVGNLSEWYEHPAGHQY